MYRDKFISELKKTELKVSAQISLGVPKVSKRKDRALIFQLNSRVTLQDRDFYKLFRIFQKRVKVLKTKCGLKKFAGMTCTTFSFSSEKFAPLGELALPAILTLRGELTEKLGKPELCGFIISFEDSPIGIKKANFELNQRKLIVEIVAGYDFAEVQGIFKRAFIHAKQLSNLFVKKR